MDREGPDERRAAEPAEGPQASDLGRLLEAVALGMAVAYVPLSACRCHQRDDVVHLPVSDLSESRVLVARPETSRSPAVAAFVRLAQQVAESCPDQAAAFG